VHIRSALPSRLRGLATRSSAPAEFSGFLPTPFVLGGGGSLSLTISRAGHVYFGLNPGVGVGGGLSVRAGEVHRNGKRAEGCEIDHFLEGSSVSVSGDTPGSSLGVSVNQEGIGVEIGVGAGVSVTGGYNFHLFELF
jgi:hypothetical protein